MERQDKKLIIFDFDGVFNLNSMEAYYHTYNLALHEIGVKMETLEQQKVIDRAWGSSHKEILLELLREVNGGSIDPDKVPPVDQQLFSRSVKAFEEILADDFPEIIRPVPGASKMLGRLASKYTLALNTAADPEVLLEKVMPKLDIQPQMFEGGMMMALDLIDDRKALPKPHPYTTLKLMERNNVEPSQTIMVGDSGADVETAMYAGVESIYVPLTGKLTAAEVAEYGVEALPDVTYLERRLGRAGIILSNPWADMITT